ncbi:MAG: hypothetical protein ACKN87_22445 [Microcystis aeruginosa]
MLQESGTPSCFLDLALAILVKPDIKLSKKRNLNSDRYWSNNYKFLLRVGSDRGIMARMSLIVRNLVKQGFWQDASLANALLGVIWGKWRSRLNGVIYGKLTYIVTFKSVIQKLSV